jgi:hypothetical protein
MSWSKKPVPGLFHTRPDSSGKRSDSVLQPPSSGSKGLPKLVWQQLSSILQE